MTDTESKPNALQSLWGSGDVARDRARRNTVKSMASPGERPQEIYTPQSIIDVCLEVWPEGIAMDPCSGPDSIVPATIKLDGSEGKDGLKTDWAPFTYVNPPFKYLKQWLEKAENEVVRLVENSQHPEIILLCPVRTHRVWYRRTLDGCRVTTVFLDPLKFHGYAQAFPAPLALHYWGSRKAEFLHACRKVSKR